MLFERITRCLDLTEANISYALRSRERTKGLLERLAAIAKPNDGAAKILIVFARMSTTACEWLDGDLRIAVSRQGDSSRFEVTTELALGLSERVFPPFVLPVPILEFTRALERVPKAVAPLGIVSKNDDHFTLSATEMVRKSMRPTAISIAEECLIAPEAAARVVTKPNAVGGEDEQSAIDSEWGE